MRPSTGTGGQRSIIQSGQTASSKHATSPTKRVKGASEPTASGAVKTKSE